MARIGGIVCIHGFTGSPFDLRHLAADLGAAGVADVRVPVLPGHLTTVEDLDRQTWQDWRGAIDREVASAAAAHGPITVVGQSLGGLLALDAAARHPDAVARVVSLAAPLWLTPVSERAAALALRLGLAMLPKIGGPDIRNKQELVGSPAYATIPVRALGQLRAFMRVVAEELPRIAQPALVMHAANDHTAPVACALVIAREIRARRLRILPRSYHLIASDVERDVVAAEVISFLSGD